MLFFWARGAFQIIMILIVSINPFFLEQVTTMNE